MFIDTSDWKPDHPGWTFNKNDASYRLTPGDTSSRLSSPILPIGENRTITLSAEILGGFGMVYVRGYDKVTNGSTTFSDGNEGGVVALSHTFNESFDRYQLIISAWPGVSNVPGKVIDPIGQAITFRNVSNSLVPVYGEVAAPEAVAPPVVQEEPAHTLSSILRAAYYKLTSRSSW